MTAQVIPFPGSRGLDSVMQAYNESLKLNDTMAALVDRSPVSFQNNYIRDKILRPQVKTLCEGYLASRMTADEFFLAFQYLVFKCEV